MREGVSSPERKNGVGPHTDYSTARKHGNYEWATNGIVLNPIEQVRNKIEYFVLVNGDQSNSNYKD